jgi:CRP/FNR family transcriptional regulator
MFRIPSPDAAAPALPQAASWGRDPSNPALAGVPPGLLRSVLAGCVEWTVPAGRLLLPQDQHADVCYGLGTGLLRLQREGPQGRPATAALLHPGRWVACTHALTGTPLSFSVATVTRSTVLVLRKSMLQDLLEHHPAATAGWLLHIATAQADALAAHLDLLATGSVEERVLRLLHLLAQPSPGHAGGARRITVRLTQGEMGSIVGASRQRVNKTLGVLLRQGRLRVDGPWLEIGEDLCATPDAVRPPSLQ